MRLCLRFALLALASLLLLQIAAAQSDASSCAENCRFVVVPSLGPAGPAGLNGTDGRDGLNGTNGLNGKDGLNATLDKSITYSGLKMASAELSGATTFAAGATLVSPISTGLAREYRTTIGPAVGETCRGNTTGNTIILVVSPTSPGMWPGFGWNEIGSIVHWADGTTSTITDAVGGGITGDTWGKEGTISDATVRVNADCKFYRASNHLLSDGRHTSVPGPFVLHNNGGIIALSTDKLPDRYRATWNFPGTGYGVTATDTFVGTDAAQTITNKVITASAETLCNVTQTGTLLTVVSGGCSFGPSTAGTLVIWPDGITANVLNATTFGSLSATMTNSLERPTPTIVKTHGGTVLSGRWSTINERLVLKGLTGNSGSSAVVIDMTQMKQPAQGGSRTRSTWSFPPPPDSVKTPVNYFVGEDVAQTVSNKVINSSVIKASETNGHFRMKNYGSLGISDPLDTAPDYIMINVTIAGSLVTCDTERFYPSNIGSVLEWSDGPAAVIQSVGPLGALAGSTTSTVARAFQIPRAWQMVKFWTANTMLSNNFAMFQDKIALKAVIGTAGSALTIDVTKMRVDAGVRHQTSWTFPHPGPAGQQNYFVGEQTVQTLSNKILDAAKCNNGLTISSGGLTVPAGGLSIAGGGLTVTTGGLTVTTGGLTVMNGGLSVTHGMTAATLTLQTSLTFQNGWMNVPAAGLNVAGGPLIAESLRVWGVTELYDTLAIKAGGIEAPPEGMSITGGGVIGGLKVDRIEGNSRSATVAFGAATGAGGWAKFLDNSPSSSIAGTLHVNIGSTTVTNQILVIVSLNTAAPAVVGRCVVTLTAGNQMAATLPSDKQVYVNVDRMSGLQIDQFEIWMVNPLPVGQYYWNYHVIC